MGKRVAASVLTLALAGTWTWAQTPLGTAFTYQGRLTDNGASPTGAYDFRFILYTADVGGSQVGPVVARDDVAVVSGLFTVSLDFGPGAFAGSARFLEIGVRPGASSGAYTVLSSRVELTPSPNSIFSEASLWSGLTGIPAGFADGVDNDSGGDITAVAAGSGLSGGGASGAVSLAVTFAGTGAATNASRSDHDHAGTYAGTTHNHLGEAWSGSPSPGLTVSTTGSRGLWGETAASDGRGVVGVASSITGSTTGVWGEGASNDARGVSGLVTATSGTTFGVTGQSNSTSGRGVWGYASATSGNNYGVWGQSASDGGRGVLGWASATTGPAWGVYARTDSSGGRAVYASATATSGAPYGVYAETVAPGGTALYGHSTATTGFNYGIYGRSNSDAGVAVGAFATSTTGATYGLWAQSNSPDGVGVVGNAFSTTGNNVGVRGLTGSPNGVGVTGRASSTTGVTRGVLGETLSDSGTGVQGIGALGVLGVSSSTTGTGVSGTATATSGATRGVYGVAVSPDGTGVVGRASATSGFNYGVNGSSVSPNGAGVYGLASAASGVTDGVRGYASSTSGAGVFAWATSASGLNYGIYALTSSASGYAGYFDNRVHVNGALSKASGSFKIDHPLDPERKYLYHSFVESPDMMNVYNGNVVLDGKGEAAVTLPDWFEALNRDYRYQLTCIGGFAPVFVAQKIEGGRFRIGGGIPGLEVSWQVTGIRKDAWAEKNRVPVEEEKPATEQGTYLHPQVFGQPEEKGATYERQAEARRAKAASENRSLEDR